MDFGDQPIAHRLFSGPSDDEYVHPIGLDLYQTCGLIQIMDPVPPSDLYTQYNWLSSWKAIPHASRLPDLIEELPGLGRSAKVVEVACNDGTFLEAMRARAALHQKRILFNAPTF